MKTTYCFLLLFISLPVHALKITRVILATDTNPDYIQFWPTVAKAWEKIIGIRPTLALIAPLEIEIDETVGDVIRFEPIEGIPTSLQAQVIRLLLPAYFETEGCLISDIDMLPLSREYFINSVLNYPDDSFIVYRNNAYHSHEQKYPMCYVAAQGHTFKEVFKIHDVSDIQEIIKRWNNENLGWNTDELILYQCLNQWADFKTRCITLDHGVQRRIDRSNWTYNDELLRQHYYIDAHCPRPYSHYKYDIDSVLDQCLWLKSITIYPHDETLLTSYQPLGEFDVTGELYLIQKIIRTGDIVFDVGANKGDWTHCVLEHTVPAQIYAFEPLPMIAQEFTKNVTDERVQLLELALSNKKIDSYFFYYQYENGVLSSLYKRNRVEKLFGLSADEICVKTTTLNEFCRDRAIERINFLKIDTEGSELDILKGASDLLKEQKIDYIQFEYGQTYTDSRTTLKEIVRFLISFGYSIFKIHQNGIVHIKAWFDGLENYYQSNFLAISGKITQGSYKTIFENALAKRFLENPDYGTHMAPLFTAVMRTDGPILEMGAGDYSTPLLHALCSEKKRFLLTVETDQKWIDNFIDLKNFWHDFIYVSPYGEDSNLPTWDSVGNDQRWSIVLIDHRPGERRVRDIERLRNNTDIFVVHDTQQPSYNYEPLLSTFRYKYVYERYSTQTMLASDTIDVSKFFKE